MSLISAMKNVKFNIYGVLLFMLIMIPNFIWFMVKAPNDILRIESITPTIDLIASIFQIIMIICFCFSKDKNNKIGISSLVSLVLYFV